MCITARKHETQYATEAKIMVDSQDTIIVSGGEPTSEKPPMSARSSGWDFEKPGILIIQPSTGNLLWARHPR